MSFNLNSAQRTDKQIAMRVSVNTVIVNLILSIFKLIAGITGHSGAMISDAIHSASDVFSTFIVMIGVNISSKESDAEHQYGHERMECVASIILATLLIITGAGIGLKGLEQIFSNNTTNIMIPSIVTLVAAVLSIVIKELMYWYTRHAAKKVQSSALLADAWHHRSDALSSVGSLVGILGARMGLPIMDSVASVVICVFVLKVGYDIFKDSINKMVDRSCDPETLNQIKEKIEEQEGVMGISDIKTRIFGTKIYIDVEIMADGNLTLLEAHSIAETVHDTLEAGFPIIKHCMVHVNPNVSIN